MESPSTNACTSLCMLCTNFAKGTMEIDVTAPLSDGVVVIHHPTAASLFESSKSCAFCLFLSNGVGMEGFNVAQRLAREGRTHHDEIRLLNLDSMFGYKKNRRTNDKRTRPTLSTVELSRRLSLWKVELRTDEKRWYQSESFLMAPPAGDWERRPFWGTTSKIEINMRVPIISKWLDDCDISHERCFRHTPNQTTKPNPTRLLHVCEVDGVMTIRLEEMNRVQENAGVPYLALSYCWGREALPLTLTKATRDSFLKDIPPDLLPLTLKDAVLVTRALGYNYIWIDSLCIVQDDDRDWTHEASMMARIFRNADLTISAASSKTSAGGLNLHAISPAQRFGCHPECNDKRNVQLAIRTMRPGTLDRDALRDCPINQRGWIFQEIGLSRRTVYFAYGHIIWQCRETLESDIGYLRQTVAENSQDPLLYVGTLNSTFTDTPLASLSDLKTPCQQYHTWWRWMFDFFKKYFTYEQDCLPSLAGIIQFWKEETGDEPVVGLWLEWLPFHLCWCFQKSQTVEQDWTRDPNQPSWSWTSVPLRYRRHIRFPDVTTGFDMSLRGHPPREVAWQMPVQVTDIKWEAQPLVSRLQKATLTLDRYTFSRNVLEKYCLTLKQPSTLWDNPLHRAYQTRLEREEPSSNAGDRTLATELAGAEDLPLCLSYAVNSIWFYWMKIEYIGELDGLPCYKRLGIDGAQNSYWTKEVCSDTQVIIKEIMSEMHLVDTIRLV